MGTEDAPPLTVAGDVLKHLAPELAPHVHSFLHGGAPGMLVNTPAPDWRSASSRVRELHLALEEAILRKREPYHVLVLAVAVRLQAVIVYATVKKMLNQ